MGSYRSTLRSLLICISATGLIACGDDAGTQEVAADDTAAAVSQERREQQAFLILTEARTALTPDKVKLYQRLIAIYPDTEYISRAYMELVDVMVRTGRLEEAFDTTRAYAQRFPREKEVFGTFTAVFLTNYRAEGEARTLSDVAVLDEWERYAEEACANSGELPEGDRGLVFSATGRLLLHRAGIQPERKDELYEKAAEMYSKAATHPFPGRPIDEVETHFKLGQIRALQGDHQRAQVHFEVAMELRNKYDKGWPEDIIIDQLKALDIPPENGQ